MEEGRKITERSNSALGFSEYSQDSSFSTTCLQSTKLLAVYKTHLQEQQHSSTSVCGQTSKGPSEERRIWSNLKPDHARHPPLAVGTCTMWHIQIPPAGLDAMNNPITQDQIQNRAPWARRGLCLCQLQGRHAESTWMRPGSDHWCAHSFGRGGVTCLHVQTHLPSHLHSWSSLPPLRNWQFLEGASTSHTSPRWCIHHPFLKCTLTNAPPHPWGRRCPSQSFLWCFQTDHHPVWPSRPSPPESPGSCHAVLSTFYIPRHTCLCVFHPPDQTISTRSRN